MLSSLYPGWKAFKEQGAKNQDGKDCDDIAILMPEWLPGLGLLAIVWLVCGVIGWREMHPGKKAS